MTARNNFNARIAAASKIDDRWHATAIAGLILSYAILSPNSAWAASKPPKRLTCSFIAEQCMRECPKQASRPFCSQYCGDNKSACLRTGSWYGIAQQFTNVDRK